MLRNTRQRKSIKSVYETAGRPLGPDEVLDLARKSVPGLGIATVYRTVKSLVEEGWLVPVDLPGAPPRYERAGLRHHHHFHCTSCSRVFDIEGCVADLSNLVPDGFKMKNHHITLFGLCDSCRDSEGVKEAGA